jgi:hypothetical protein
MARATKNTLDHIHMALLGLGYVAGEFGAARSGPTMFGIYRKPGESVVVSWYAGCSVYDVSGTTAAAIDILSLELTRVGLTCITTGKDVHVHAQEHVDAVVMKMLQ